MEKPSLKEVEEEFLKHRNDGNFNIIGNVKINPMHEQVWASIYKQKDGEIYYIVTLAIYVGPTSMTPTMYGRDRRCKKLFKYKDYAYLPDAMQDMVQYINHSVDTRQTKTQKHMMVVI
jgi:hypothetical protein